MAFSRQKVRRMARINIEDSLYRDSRWLKLLLKVGCEYKALGLITKAWTIAQDNWLQFGSVPKKAWLPELDILLEVELAERNQDGSVYVKGSRAAFGWLEQRSQAGQKNKGKKRGKKKTTVNGSSSFDNDSNPLTLTPSLALSPTLTQTQAPSLKPLAETASVRLSYQKAYEKRYGLKPVWAAKENALAKKLVSSIGKNEAEKIAELYPFFNDPWHVKQKHPFGLLVAQLDKVRVELANPDRMMDSKQAQDELNQESLKRNILKAFRIEE